nr:MAG TPA: hypothetical protein [Caudoviricetes sp.]DAQ95512.1 MAG TPA: hypothetical protein [Caudoviricetes sp.]
MRKQVHYKRLIVEMGSILSKDSDMVYSLW